MLDFLNEPNPFGVYENVEQPKVSKISLPLGDMTLPDDLYIGNNGIIQAKSNIPETKETNNSQFIIDNNEEYQPNLEYSTDKNYSVNKNTKGRVQKALNFFVSKGLSPHAAAGIVGNLMLESGSKDLSKTDNVGDKNLGPKRSSYGIAQWRLDRKTALKNFAAKRGKSMSDFDTQLEFLWDEINGSQKKYKVLEGLQNSKSVKEATEHFMNTFERPNKDPKINGINQRIKYAESLLS